MAAVHLELNHINGASEPRFGCGVCRVCTDDCFSGSSCLRASTVLLQSLSSTGKKRKRGCENGLLEDAVLFSSRDDQDTTNEDSDDEVLRPLKASRASSPARNTSLALLHRSTGLQQDYLQHIDKALQKHELKSDLDYAGTGSWKAAAGGTARTMPRHCQGQGIQHPVSLLTRRSTECDSISNQVSMASQVANHNIQLEVSLCSTSPGAQR